MEVIDTKFQRGESSKLLEKGQFPVPYYQRPVPVWELIRVFCTTESVRALLAFASFAIMYRRARLPLPLVAGAVGIGILSGSFIFRPALEEYWSQHPALEDAQAASSTAPDQSSPSSSAEATVPALTKA